jgi:hypothetical protein
VRRIFELVLAVTVAVLVATGIKRLLEPDQRQAIRPARNAAASERPAKQGSSRQGPTRDELYSEAQRLEIEGRSKMNKKELAEAVEAAKTGEPV